ncbi:MAG: class I SAM-dependent methyltransferase [Clostridiales bacterium]|nr:class I SAM-dependent methyltransferase [Clostridiales bacterium]
MGERKRDKSLGIKTVGIREWKDRRVQYNRYEATPYKALDKLFKYYKLDKTDKVVDFGCGRGRVTFYIHNRFQLPVTGIEVNADTYEEALDNKSSYRLKARHINAPINLQYGLAEHYEIDDEDNCFYFFNPFSVQIFKKVVTNILHSIREANRTVDLILYYPLPEYKKFLKDNTPFEIINKIKIPWAIDKYEKFIIYRLREEDI